MVIESNLKCGKYTEKDIIRIYNRDQQTFYVDSGVYPIDLYTSYAPKNKMPIEEFLKPQRRFKHLFKPGNEDLIAAFQAEVDKRWEELQEKCN